MRRLHERKHPRRRSYDYMQPGAYFVTFLTHARKPILGELVQRGVLLTDAGRIVELRFAAVAARFEGVAIDTYVVMPDHVHALVVLSSTPNRTVNLSQVVGWVKQRAARAINSSNAGSAARIWHCSFHDIIIKDASAFVRIRHYISANPARAWRETQLRHNRSHR